MQFLALYIKLKNKMKYFTWFSFIVFLKKKITCRNMKKKMKKSKLIVPNYFSL